MQLVRATGEEVEEVGYSGLTVRNVARRAGVAPATAYNYFSSKDHLLAEVLWRRIQALPPVEPATGSGPVSQRLAEAVAPWSCSPPRVRLWSTPARWPCSAPTPT